MANSKNKKELADLLVRQRGRRPVNEMARILNVHPNTLGNYERSERLPDVDFLAAFSVATATPFATLLNLRLKESERAEAQEILAGDASFGGTVDLELLEVVIEAVDEALATAKKKLAPAKRAKVYTLLYERYREQGAAAVDTATVLRLVDVAA